MQEYFLSGDIPKACSESGVKFGKTISSQSGLSSENPKNVFSLINSWSRLKSVFALAAINATGFSPEQYIMLTHLQKQQKINRKNPDTGKPRSTITCWT